MAARHHASFRTAVNVREFHWFLTRLGGENRAVTEQINRFSLLPVEDWNTPVRLRVIPRCHTAGEVRRLADSCPRDLLTALPSRTEHV